MSIRSFAEGAALREVHADDAPDDDIQARLPSQVQVGYRTMSLRWTNPAEQRRKHNTRLGECSVNTGLIEIDPSFGMQEAANTLVHELLHACTNVAGLKIDEADEEHFVTATANVMTNVIRETPELFEWLIEAARAD